MHHLSLWIFRSETGCPEFNHICQFGDGGHRRLGSLGKFLLTSTSPRHQQLCVFNQGLGRLQDALSEHREGTSCFMDCISVLDFSNTTPVVSKSLCVFSVEGACRGKHDGSVQVCNNSRHSAGGCDTGLCATIPRLESSQYMRDLWKQKQTLQCRKLTGTLTKERIVNVVQLFYLLRDFSCTFYELFFGKRVIWAALQSTCLSHQTRATETQLTHLLLNVMANLTSTKLKS